MNKESIELLQKSQQVIALKMRDAEMMGMMLEELLEKEKELLNN